MSADGEREKDVEHSGYKGRGGGCSQTRSWKDKKSVWGVLTGPWLWWRDPITLVRPPLPHHHRAYRQEQSRIVWVSDGCCVIPPPPLVLLIDSPKRNPPPFPKKSRKREWWERYKVSFSSNLKESYSWFIKYWHLGLVGSAAHLPKMSIFDDPRNP